MEAEKTTEWGEGLISFLATKTPTEKLQAALEVLQEFKSHESTEEWMACPFVCWTKFEQFEDYLKLLTGNGSKEVEDKRAKDFLTNVRGDAA